MDDRVPDERAVAEQPYIRARLVPVENFPQRGFLLRVGEHAHLRVEPAKRDRKSTRLNSSHLVISYAVFCLKKKKKKDRLNLVRGVNLCMSNVTAVVATMR